MPDLFTIKNTRAFANTAARVSAIPDFVGQVGVQVDDGSIWRATAISVGSWESWWLVRSVAIVGTTGLGFVQMNSQGVSAVSVPAGGVRLYGRDSALAILDSTDREAQLDTTLMTTNRVFSFPDASGTFALTSNVATTFANAAARAAATPSFVGQLGIQVDLGSIWRATALSAGSWSADFSLDGLTPDYVNFPNQSPEPGNPGAGLRVYVANATQLVIKNSVGDAAYFNFAITDDRSYTFPDADGTFLLAGDILGTANQITVTGNTLSIASGRGLIRQGLANGTAVLAATPDYDGQWITATDGYVGLGTGTGAGNVQGVFVVGGGIVFPVGEWQFTGNISQQAGTTADFRNTTVTGTLTSTGLTLLATSSTSSGLVVGSSLMTSGFSILGLNNNTAGAAQIVARSTGNTGLSAIEVQTSDVNGGITLISGNTASGGIFQNRHFVDFFYGLDGTATSKCAPVFFRTYGHYSGNAEGHFWFSRDSDGNTTWYSFTVGTVDNSCVKCMELSAAGNLILGGGTSATELRFLEPSGSGTHYSAWRAGAQSDHFRYTLPTTAPTVNQVLAATAVSGSNPVEVTTGWATASGGTAINGIANGRLTLATGNPVPTSTITGAGTVYFTPYRGNQIALYDGSSAWTVLSFSELSITLSALSANTAYDVFAYNNAGSVALDTTAWSSSTARATALTLQDGVFVKSGATTRRYLGSIILDGSKQCSVNFGGSADGGTAGRCDVWNFNNRERITFCVRDTTNSWAWTTVGWQQANASAGNQVLLMAGLATQATAAVSHNAGGTTNVRLTGVGYDSTTALASFCTTTTAPPGGTAITGLTASFAGLIDVGQHQLAWIEHGNGSVTFYGDNNTTYTRSGLTVMWEY